MRKIFAAITVLGMVGVLIYSCGDSSRKESERREEYLRIANTEFVLAAPAENIAVLGYYSNLTPPTMVVRNNGTEKTMRLIGLVSGHRGGDEQHWFQALAPGATVEIPPSLHQHSARIRVENETGTTIGLFPLGCHAR